MTSSPTLLCRCGEGQDTMAGKDEKHKALIEDGIAISTNAPVPAVIAASDWEDDRVAILRDIETTPFFQAVRGDLVVSLYNQKEIWPIFGYEGRVLFPRAAISSAGSTTSPALSEP